MLSSISLTGICHHLPTLILTLPSYPFLNPSSLLYFHSLHPPTALSFSLFLFPLSPTSLPLCPLLLQECNKDNLGKVFANPDAVYVLSYSILMLNTDQHNPLVKNRMTLEVSLTLEVQWVIFVRQPATHKPATPVHQQTHSTTSPSANSPQSRILESQSDC